MIKITNILQKNKRYQELDALRGISVLLVVFFHFTMGKSEFNSVFKLGVTGVDLFFIISGFVIFISLQQISRGRDFVINRISRLYPTYCSSVTFTFLLLFLYSLYSKESISSYLPFKYLGNLTMIQFYLNIPDLDGPYWSLIVELLFYLSMLIVYKLNVLRFLNGIGIVLSIIIIFSILLFDKNRFVNYIVYYIPLFQFFPLFLSGTVFYKIYISKQNKIINYLIILFCFICQILLFPYVGRSYLFINHLQYCFMLFLYFFLFFLFVNNYLTFIVNSITLFFGKISYALYLIHQCLSMDFIFPFFYKKLHMNFWIVSFFIALPISIGVATFITNKIEIPFSKKIKKMFNYN